MAVVTEVMAMAVVAGVTVLLVRFLRDYLHFRKLELAIPGPPSLFLLGNALDFAFMTPNTVMKTVLRLIDGRREACRGSILNRMILVVQDPEQIDEVVRSKKFDDKPFFFYKFLRTVAEKGMIQLNGAEWKAHRKWLAPGFNMSVLNSLVPIFSEEAKGFVDRIEADKDVSLVENLRKTAVRNFLRTSMFSEESLQFEEALIDIAEFVELFLHTVNNRSFNPVLWSDRIFGVTPLGKRVFKVKQVIHKHCSSFIAKKREDLKRRKIGFDIERARKTLMDIMLDIPDPTLKTHMHLDDDVIVDEFITFFGANVESTATTVNWVLKALSMLPEVQEKVHAELDSVFGDSDRNVSVEDLPQLKYLNRVIKEGMRMFPVVPFVARHCYEETELFGYTIPAGSFIVLNIFGAHHDPKHWYKPEVFDPNRFLPENCKDRHPCAYIPFSAGPRNCIGYKFAMMNLTTLLATTLRAYKVLPVDDHKDLQSLVDNMTFDIASRLVGGTRVKFQRRGAMVAA